MKPLPVTIATVVLALCVGFTFVVLGYPTPGVIAASVVSVATPKVLIDNE